MEVMENKDEEIKSRINMLWDEVIQIREKEGKCRDSPQKEEAIRLMHQWAHRSEEGKRYFQRKRAEIRWRLAEMDYQEGKYDSALLQIVKGLHLCGKENEDLINKLIMIEVKINEMLVTV